MVQHGGDDAWEAALREPGELLRGAGAPTFTSRLEAWVADARIDEAARERGRERWLREVAEQEATFVGVLLELAERGAAVALTVAGRRHQGVISAMGADFVAVRTSTGSEVLLSVAAIGQARTNRAGDATVGDRMVTSELRLLDVLTELAAERDRVRLGTCDGEVVSGLVRTVGHDVVVVRVDGDPPSTAYVPASAIVEVALG